ncbi:AMP-binding protein [Rhodococcus aetherivorans]|uniref:AMP-binding protein n=1 Tax=Rhodococcus aetherivorans TaxID=191292 RepID=UPI00163B5E9F|nr:AMP-binding protein [Rhodococcus aetherivorans]MBC2589683.1 AMP-binding protein [Rhodococcus aetherivorans]
MTGPATIRCGNDIRTHTQVRDRASRLAAALSALGVAHGDRYAIVMRNEIGFVEATLAGAAIGAVPVPANWHGNTDDLGHVLTDSGARIALVHTDLLPKVESVLPVGATIVEVPVPAVLADAYGTDIPPLSGRYANVEDLIATHEPHTTGITDPPMSVIYTSGTTGRPKGILRRPTPPEKVAALHEVVIEAFAFGTARSTLVAAPMYHTAPNTQFQFAFALGMNVEIMPRFDPEGLLRTIEERRIEHLQVVPTMFVRLLKLPEEVRARYDLSSLTSVVHAAAPCPADVKRAVIDWLGPIVHEYYGGSESGAAVCCTSEEWLAHPGTVGRPFSDAAVRIVGADGHDAPVGEDGDIYLRPFSAWPDFTYLGDDAKRRGMEIDGYVTVGDIGHVDVDGYLYLSDRRNDMIISGGVNIYPAEIEAAILALDGVADAAVFGIPDPEFGEVVAAHVQPDPGATLTEDEVRRHVERRLARFKAPKVVVFEESLPREDTGKLFKRRLKAPYWEAQVAGPAVGAS